MNATVRVRRATRGGGGKRRTFDHTRSQPQVLTRKPPQQGELAPRQRDAPNPRQATMATSRAGLALQSSSGRRLGVPFCRQRGASRDGLLRSLESYFGECIHFAGHASSASREPRATELSARWLANESQRLQGKGERHLLRFQMWFMHNNHTRVTTIVALPRFASYPWHLACMQLWPIQPHRTSSHNTFRKVPKRQKPQ